MPTQMGRMAVPWQSFRTTIGMLVTGSIISPRIFISTSIPPSFRLISVYTFAGQRIRARAGHANLDITPQQVPTRSATRSGVQEIERLVLRRPSDPLTGGRVESFDQASLHRTNVVRVAPHLDGALPFLENGQPQALLFLWNLVPEAQRRRIRPPRVLEAEDRVVLHFLDEPERDRKSTRL